MRGQLCSAGVASYVIGAPAFEPSSQKQQQLTGHQVQDGGMFSMEDTCESAPCWDPNSSSSRPAGKLQNQRLKACF